MGTYGGPNIPTNNLTYIWDFSNPKCINDISGAYGNELFTQTNLDPTNGATIHSGSSPINNYLEVDGNNDQCPTGIDVSWNNTNSVSWGLLVQSNYWSCNWWYFRKTRFPMGMVLLAK